MRELVDLCGFGDGYAWISGFMRDSEEWARGFFLFGFLVVALNGFDKLGVVFRALCGIFDVYA